MPALKWTARTFNFDFPVGMMPFILERLYGTAARIQKMTEHLSPEQVILQPANGWSIQEHIGHLIDLDELHEGRIDDYLNDLPVLRAADMSNQKTYGKQYNRSELSHLINDFDRARLHFIQRLQQLDLQKTALHPRLQKPMRVVDMAFFVAEHDDHHLAIIRERIDI